MKFFLFWFWDDEDGDRQCKWSAFDSEMELLHYANGMEPATGGRPFDFVVIQGEEKRLRRTVSYALDKPKAKA